MANLKLFIDPHEVEYPSLVREILVDATRKTNISALVTALGKCLLICDNSVYVWSFVAKESGIPHATRMNLPASGLKYSVKLVCLFSRGSQYVRHGMSMVAVSPEGNVRFWAELGKPHRDESCLLNNEVAHSIQLVDSQEQVHRFLVTTTTGSFHMIDIFHGAAGQSERIATRPLDVGGPGGGIGRRMSLLLFGSSTAEKDQIIKTLYVKNKPCTADVVNVLARYMRFYAIFERKLLLHEIDISDMALTKYNKNRELAERRHFHVVDASLFRSGILLFFVGVLSSREHIQSDKQLFIGYYEETIKGDELTKDLKTLLRVEIPESLSATGLDKRLMRSNLLVTSDDECAIIFPDAFLLIRHPTKTNSTSTLCLENFGDANEQLLGTAAVHGYSHLVLKQKGLCTVRRLPELYDLSFWKKYRSVLHKMEEPNVFPGADQRLKEAFIEFCAKNMKQTKKVLQELFTSLDRPIIEGENDNNMELQLSSQHKKDDNVENNISDMVIDLVVYLLDRQPSFQDDPRWAYTANTSLSNDQKAKLHDFASTRKFSLILRQLGDKHSHYKMAILFLRTFNLLERIDQPVQTSSNRSGKAIIAELGEKLSAMIVCFHWLAENSQTLPLVNAAINELAKQYITRLGMPKGNPYLSPSDLVFTRVSSFHEIVPVLVQISEQSMDEHGRNRTEVLTEVGSFLVTLIEGIKEIHNGKWALSEENSFSSWLNQPDFLTYFITHLNSAMDFLEASTNRINERSSDIALPTQQFTTIFEHCVRLANFILAQQSPTQRNDSKIIARFVTLGKPDVALGMAEEYKDFTMLVVYCHKQLEKQQCAKTLERYKERYEKDGFHDFLYTWYQQNGMYNHLLAERGERVSDFLSKRQQINWIRQIDEEEFGKAKRTLRKMAEEEGDSRKKLIAFSLAKMAALCEEGENVAEVAELSDQIRRLHESHNNTNVPGEQRASSDTPFKQNE